MSALAPGSGDTARNAITVDGVSKRFRLYHERNQSLKSTLLRRGRASYEEFWALRDVSLAVPKGMALGLIGENGSGKSTLLKCMARILRPDAGRISTEGKVSALLELGAGFHHELSGRENVYLNGSILGLSKKELDRKFDDIVDFAGLERFIDTPVKNYSSGMYLRLGFSVAINVNPDVLLVDEVLAVGDESFQRRCREKFGELRAQGRTVVLVSHALDSVRELCDAAAWLEAGRLRAMGDVDEVVDHYLHLVYEGAAGGAQATPSGSGRSVIAHIDLLDQKHEPTREALTGDRVTIRFHYELDGAVGRPLFALAIHTVDGVEVTATDTARLAVAPEPMARGHVDFEVESLPLLPGTYDVSAVLSDQETGAVLDAHHRAFRFVVDAGAPTVSSRGIVDVDGTWQVYPWVPSEETAGGPG